MKIAAALIAMVMLQGCGVYQILGPKWVESFDEFTSWADTREKVEDWAKRCTRYSQDTNDWPRKPSPGDRQLTKDLARSLWKHKRGACGQFAAMYVYCGLRHRATCGYIQSHVGQYGGHIMAWIEEQDGTVTRTDNQYIYRSEYGSKKHMMDFWMSMESKVIIYDGSWNVLKKNY